MDLFLLWVVIIIFTFIFVLYFSKWPPGCKYTNHVNKFSMGIIHYLNKIKFWMLFKFSSGSAVVGPPKPRWWHPNYTDVSKRWEGRVKRKVFKRCGCWGTGRFGWRPLIGCEEPLQGAVQEGQRVLSCFIMKTGLFILKEQSVFYLPRAALNNSLFTCGFCCSGFWLVTETTGFRSFTSGNLCSHTRRALRSSRGGCRGPAGGSSSGKGGRSSAEGKIPNRLPPSRASTRCGVPSASRDACRWRSTRRRCCSV